MEPLQPTATLDEAAYEAPIRLLAPGTAIAERYEIRGVLGQGGYAVVYRAKDRELGREIALKVLRQERVSDQTLARFRREVALAQETSSPHVVRVFDIGASDSAVFLTMELVLGESLKERLRRGALPVSETIRIGLQVLAGLEALHRLGIVHRDLKPGNILLTEDGDVKLADFGLARRFDRDEAQLTGTTALLGTIDYLSPEQALGREVDQRTDLYAFGVVLFEMLSGKPPFVATSSLETLLAHLKRRAPDIARTRADAPRWLAAVVARLLEKEPAKRYADTTSVVADLRQGRGPRVRQMLRGRTVRAAALSALVLVGAGATWWQLHTRPQFSRFIRDGASGIAAVDQDGEVLWRKSGADFDFASLAVQTRLKRGGRRLLAGFFFPRDDYTPGESHTLHYLDPKSGKIVKRVTLPSMAGAFPDFSNRFRPVYVAAVDLDEEGSDEIVVSFMHQPEWPMYTVLYEPRGDRARTIFAGSGASFAGAEDLDGDGRKELLFFGINNPLGWVYGLAAVRLDPWIGEGSATSASLSIVAPGLTSFPEDDRLLWYSILPRGRLLEEDERRLTSDPRRRTLTVTFADGRKEVLAFNGLPMGIAGAEAAQRGGERRLAYRHLREVQRLLTARFPDEALREVDLGRQAAHRAKDPRLEEIFERFRGRALVAARRFAEADGLFVALADSSAAASEIAFDAAEAFHLQGELRRAAMWYERGMGRGGANDAGKSRHRYLEGAVFALCELGEWDEALAVIGRYASAYGGGDDTALYREYVHWWSRAPIEAISRPTPVDDVTRYVMLEHRHALGEDPRLLLRDIAANLATVYETRGELLSLKGELLAQLGRQQEALATARRAVETLESEKHQYVVARAHLGLARQRLAAIEAKEPATLSRR